MHTAHSYEFIVLYYSVRVLYLNSISLTFFVFPGTLLLPISLRSIVKLED